MTFRVNVIVAIDVCLFSHVYFFFAPILVYSLSVGKSIMYETQLIYLSFSRAFNV